MELVDYAILKVLNATGPTSRRQAVWNAKEFLQATFSTPERFMAEVDRLILLRLLRYDYGLRTVEITETGKKELGEMSNRLINLATK